MKCDRLGGASKPQSQNRNGRSNWHKTEFSRATLEGPQTGRALVKGQGRKQKDVGPFDSFLILKSLCWGRL